MSTIYRVMCEGVAVLEFDNHEDAGSAAAGWNHAYPPPLYAVFTVEPDDCPDAECGYCDGSPKARSSLSENGGDLR